MLDTIIKSINDTKDINGNIVFFRVYKGDIIIRLAKLDITEKNFLIIHNSTGLEQPTIFDFEKDNKTCLYNKGRFSFSRKNLINRLNSNIKNYKNKFTINDFRDIKTAIKNLKNISPSICVIDLIQYEPTKECLEFCFKILPINGNIIITNYVETNNNLSSKAVNEFLYKNNDNICKTINSIEKTITLTKKEESTQDIIEIFQYKTESYNNESDLIQTFPYKMETYKNEPDLIISCVLRTGGPVYNYNYVNALANSIKKNVKIPHEFVCLTDDHTGFNSNVDSIIKLKHDFKKWWCKIELFRPDIFKNKRVFFLDLDTVILENIDNIVSKKFNFCGLRDFYKNDTLGSGLMSWTSGGYHHIYEKFLRNSQAIMNYTPEGDQQWINQNVDGITYFQDVFGSEIVSYKKHCIKNKIFNMPKNAKIICFHGVPKPHEINYPQIRDHWLP